MKMHVSHAIPAVAGYFAAALMTVGGLVHYVQSKAAESTDSVGIPPPTAPSTGLLISAGGIIGAAFTGYMQLMAMKAANRQNEMRLAAESRRLDAEANEREARLKAEANEREERLKIDRMRAEAEIRLKQAELEDRLKQERHDLQGDLQATKLQIEDNRQRLEELDLRVRQKNKIIRDQARVIVDQGMAIKQLVSIMERNGNAAPDVAIPEPKAFADDEDDPDASEDNA